MVNLKHYSYLHLILMVIHLSMHWNIAITLHLPKTLLVGQIEYILLIYAAILILNILDDDLINDAYHLPWQRHENSPNLYENRRTLHSILRFDII